MKRFLLIPLLVILSSPSFAADPLDANYRFSGVKAPESPYKNTWGAYQTSLFSGSAGYNFTVAVPPGTNGLTPDLSLSYSSHSVKGKAGWVGAGWDIPLSSIQRDIEYTRSNAGDDTFDLYLDGGKHDLVYVAAEGRYHTKVESYLKVEKKTGAPNERGEYWVVTAKNGTEYRFGYNRDSENMLRSSDTRFTPYVSRWSLDRIKDSNGNCIYFTYVENPSANDSGAVYLSKIEYNNDKQRVIDFVLEGADREDMYLTSEQGSETREARRLSEIRVKLNGALVRKYRLAYTMNEARNRSLLATITEFASDGTTSLPPVRFSYEATNKSFAAATPWAMPGGDWYVRKIDGDSDITNDVFDVNGDGYPDLVQGTGTYTWNIYWNNKAGTGFTGGTPWTNLPVLVSGEEWEIRDVQSYIAGQESPDTKSAPMDFNKDGYVDYIRAHETRTLKIAYNNGNGFNSIPVGTWSLAQNMSIREVERADNADENPHAHRMFVDMDGDSLPDMVRRESSTIWRVWRNTGSGFASSVDWAVSHANGYLEEFEGDSNDTESNLMDVNGDGLPDIVWGRSFEWRVYLNSGSNFLPPTNWQAPGYGADDLVNVDSTGNVQATLLDINGDGLPDIVDPINGSGLWDVYLNEGDRWGTKIQWATPITDGYTTDVERDTGNVKRDVFDIDGDGMDDIIRRTSSGWDVYKNKGGKQDLLTKITDTLGGKTSITYESSSKYSNTRLPFNYWVVSSITTNNGMTGAHAVSATTGYSYAQGLYDFPTREFRGFGQVTETRADGSKAIHSYHQDEARKGKESRLETRDTANSLFSATANAWSSSSVNNIYVSNLSVSDELTYDGVASGYKTSRKAFQNYDAYGNAGLQINHGDTTATGDEVYTYQEFWLPCSTGPWIADKVKHSWTTPSAGGAKLREGFFWYDMGSTCPTEGNLTKEEHWLDTGANPVTTYLYDDFGNRIRTTDPEGRITTVEYDSVLHTFPEKTYNPINQLTQQTFNPANGEVAQVTDPNGFVTTTTFDVFNRKVAEIKPYDTAALPTTKIQYLIDGTAPELVITSKREKAGAAGTLDTIQSVDGFGNLIQTKAEAENAAGMIATDVYYDTMGRVAKQSNPYSTGNGYGYSAPNTAIAGVAYAYDPLGRPKKVTNPDGTAVNRLFDHWTVTETDENGHAKSYTFDAGQRLKKVVENNQGQAYTTNYVYSPLGELKKIADHLGNVTTINYDSLGRKTSMSDPDMGNWKYTYDLVGNLTSQSDAKNIATLMKYDPLNRKTLVNYPNSQDISFIYDFPTKGTLAQVDDAAGTVTYKYDQRLRKTQEVRTLDNMGWVTKWSYDSLDRVASMTYPDNEIVTYTYNNQGTLESIPGVVKNLDYNAAGQVTKKDFANLRSATLTYDTASNRLKSIKTPGVQDLAYTYDNVGNIMSITDAIAGRTENFGYDGLDRLTSAGDSGYTHQYAYNAIGNMTSMTKEGASTTYSYGSGAGPHAVTGASGPYPAVGSFVINNGAYMTHTNRVTLNNVVSGNPTHYMVSEDKEFGGATWLPYAANPVRLLSAGFGVKTLYFRVKNADGVSNVKVDTIDFILDPADEFKDDDGDGLSNKEEYERGTDATLVDTDGDGWSDYEEIYDHQTDPTDSDMDDDGLPDPVDPYPQNPNHDGFSENFSFGKGMFNAGGYHRTSATKRVKDAIGSNFAGYKTTASPMITVTSGIKGTVSPPGVVVVPRGSSQTFTITPYANARIADVRVDGNSVGAVATYTFSNVVASHTLSAQFVSDGFTLTASAGPNGSITPSEQTIVSHGGRQTYNMTPIGGYHVDDVLVDGKSVGAVKSFTFEGVSDDHTISATFSNTYIIAASAGLNGRISPSGNVMVQQGGSKTFSFMPATGYHISDVILDGESLGDGMAYITLDNVSANHTLAVQFAINTYTVTPKAGLNGRISPSLPQTVKFAAYTSFILTPDQDYHTDRVIGCNGSLAGNYYSTGAIHYDCTVSANFTPIGTHSLLVQIFGRGKGKVTSQPGGITCKDDCEEIYNQDTLVTLTAEPRSGSTFSGWTGDCTGTEPTCTVTLDKARVVGAEFYSFPWMEFVPAITGGSRLP